MLNGRLVFFVPFPLASTGVHMILGQVSAIHRKRTIVVTMQPAFDVMNFCSLDQMVLRAQWVRKSDL